MTLWPWMTTWLVASRQHQGHKLFPVRFPWRQFLLLLFLLLLRNHQRPLDMWLLLSPRSACFHPPHHWVHLQRAVDTSSRQHMQKCRTVAQREPSFHPWRLSLSSYKVSRWGGERQTESHCSQRICQVYQTTLTRLMLSVPPNEHAWV